MWPFSPNRHVCSVCSRERVAGQPWRGWIMRADVDLHLKLPPTAPIPLPQAVKITSNLSLSLSPAGALPTPPLPPVLVPGRGLMPVPQALDLLAPPLSGEEAVFLNSLLELTAALTGGGRQGRQEASVGRKLAAFAGMSRGQVVHKMEFLTWLCNGR